MFAHSQLTHFLLPVICVWGVALLFFRGRTRREPDPVKRALAEFRVSILATGSILLLLWFALPSTPALGTFGYPADVQVVSQPQRLLSLLQDYNRALVRTTEVVFWMLFFVVWGLLTSAYSLAKSITASIVAREPVAGVSGPLPEPAIPVQ